MGKRPRIPAGSWPWGKTAPETRIREIRRMIERSRAQKPIIEDQAREALRRIDRNIEVLSEQLRIAQEFLEEQKRLENKKIAYALAERGIDRIREVDTADDQDALHRQLVTLLESSEDSAPEPEDIDRFLNSMDD